MVAQLRLGAEATGRPDVAAALDHLATRTPMSGTPVICHGDLHPFNVLADPDGLTLLDWTGALLADPCFDVALTELLLANPPLPLPAPLAPVVRAAGKVLARRFVTAYQRANAGRRSLTLEWFRALHSARVLIEVASLRMTHGRGAGGHPFATVAPGAARNLATATGVRSARSDRVVGHAAFRLSARCSTRWSVSSAASVADAGDEPGAAPPGDGQSEHVEAGNLGYAAVVAEAAVAVE